MDVVRQVMKGEGGVLGLYKGFVPTMVREVAGCSAMFAAYEAIKLAAVKQQVPATLFPVPALCLGSDWHDLSSTALCCLLPNAARLHPAPGIGWIMQSCVQSARHPCTT